MLKTKRRGQLRISNSQRKRWERLRCCAQWIQSGRVNANSCLQSWAWPTLPSSAWFFLLIFWLSCASSIDKELIHTFVLIKGPGDIYEGTIKLCHIKANSCVLSLIRTPYQHFFVLLFCNYYDCPQFSRFPFPDQNQCPVFIKIQSILTIDNANENAR